MNRTGYKTKDIYNILSSIRGGLEGLRMRNRGGLEWSR